MPITQGRPADGVRRAWVQNARLESTSNGDKVMNLSSGSEVPKRSCQAVILKSTKDEICIVSKNKEGAISFGEKTSSQGL
jgi:hypothetical protein